MRGLNPRAWSIDGECWCTRVDYDGHKKEWSGIAPIYAPDNRSKYIGEIEDTNIVLELPTGLKDKNGKEIYEGDIVRCSFGESGVVELRHGAYCVVGDDITDMSNWKESAFEVIGNIHENQELLGKEEE
jgi:hypothetical protein